MADFGFKIGMSVNEVKTLLAKVKVTNETKSLILSFCENDLDKKISDDIELNLLNTWASGEKEINMPNYEETSPVSFGVNSFCSIFGGSVTYKSGGHVYTTNYAPLLKAVSENKSILYDNNGDGVADEYQSYYKDYKDNKNSGYLRYTF